MTAETSHLSSIPLLPDRHQERRTLQPFSHHALLLSEYVYTEVFLTLFRSSYLLRDVEAKAAFSRDKGVLGVWVHGGFISPWAELKSEGFSPHCGGNHRQEDKGTLKNLARAALYPGGPAELLRFTCFKGKTPTSDYVLMCHSSVQVLHLQIF